MSLSALPPARCDAPDTLVVGSTVSVGDSDSTSVMVSDDASSSSVIDSVDEDSSDSADAPTLRSAATSAPDTPGRFGCPTDWPALSAMRGIAEYAWQASGRAVNAACFVALANVPAEASRYVATVASASMAGYVGYRLLVSTIGTDRCSKVLAIALGTAVSAGAGAAATYYGSALPGLAIAGSGLLGFTLSGVRHYACRHPEDAVTLVPATVAPALIIASSAGSIAVAVCVPALRTLDVGRLGRRTLALMSEAVTIELVKGGTERVIPAANRHQLSFERRLKAGLIGMLPYALASVVFNGALGNLLRAQMRSDRYEDYLAPLLVGALANVVKGAVNEAVVRFGGELSSCGAEETAAVRAAEGLRSPAAGIVIAKTALRFAIASARDILYLSLVERGLEELPSACIAYTLYAFFAQHRDLLFDMMQGAGWTEPQRRVRPNVPSD